MNSKEIEKLIQDRKNKVHDTFGDKNYLYQYLFETLDNFYYRYLETSISNDLHTSEILPKTYGALSFESNMVDALKKPNPGAKAGIIDLAKRIPKDQGPTVRYGLWVEVKDLSPEYGKMKIVSEINWGFPDFQDKSKLIQKIVSFEYNDYQVFRKELAIKLEVAAELFG
ncbi:MAG: hypothetical protein V4598_08440 [Bdellovibrionota bacterium]